MGSHRVRLSTLVRRTHAGLGSENNPTDVAILNMAVDSQSLFRRRASASSTSGENKSSIDDVFRAVLSNANRELAALLRDVRMAPLDTVLGDARAQHVSELLMRAVRCAAKQYMLQAELGSLALTDDLTGLYNRRGFMALAERQLKLGRRSGRGMTLFVMDVDRLKQINDALGHPEGDSALKRTAKALEHTFRDSDVVGRLGGDEFAVLAIEASGHSAEAIRARLFESLKSLSAQQPRYDISLSIGLARFEADSCASLEELMARADQAMYEDKNRRSWIRDARRSLSQCE
jgi:diguanylate cyclase (GGDEF)-like protein